MIFSLAQLAQYVAVVASFALAFPPGWCSGAFPPAGDERGSQSGTCCQQAAEHGSSGANQPPSESVDCCCDRDAVPVRPFELAAPALVAMWVAHQDAATGSTAVREYETTPAVFASRVPPRVLQCVWIC